MSSHTLGGASGKAGVEANSDGRQQSPDPLAALNVDKFSKARGSRKGLDEPSRVDKGSEAAFASATQQLCKHNQ